MGEKKVKQYKRALRRDKDRLIKEFVKDVKGYELKDRLRFAWAIIKG